MPVDVATFHAKVTEQLTSSDTILSIDPSTDVLDELTSGNVVFLQLYTASQSEIVLVHKEESGELVMARGYDGTTAKPWPCGACVNAIRVQPGPVCVCEDEETAVSGCCSIELVAGKGIEITPDGDKYTIALKPTGVQPGEYAGATVNDCGQLTDVPEDWPNAVEYDPCPC